MKVLFVHQNMPGQFRHLAPAIARNPANTVAFITRRRDVQLRNVRTLVYEPTRKAGPATHNYVRTYEDAVLHGQQVARIGLSLRREGFVPDLVVCHPGWGEGLFLKDVFPQSPLLNYCEFYYRSTGADVGFDPEQPLDLDGACRVRARNAHLAISLDACDAGWSPTQWQKSRHPEPFQAKIRVVFDGIDTSRVGPDPAATFVLPDGRRLGAETELITYVSRNLEPYRGFPSFVRAIPEILRRRPRAEIVVVGGDAVSYGRPHPTGRSWREVLTSEVAFDAARVHFLPPQPYGRYLALLQVSKVHVYLTVPFVLSWSFMEALAAGCILVASATTPVKEILTDGENGLLTDFFAPDRIAADVEAALEHPRRGAIAAAARRTVVERYGLEACLAAQERLCMDVAEGRLHA